MILPEDEQKKRIRVVKRVKCVCGNIHWITVLASYSWNCKECLRWYQRRGNIIMAITHPDENGWYDELEEYDNIVYSLQITKGVEV